MGQYAGVFFLHLLIVYALLLTWIVAAWLASYAARCKTSRAIKVTSVFGLLSVLAISILNLLRIVIMVPMFERGIGILSANYRATFVLLIVPWLMTLWFAVPVYWKSIRMPPLDVAGSRMTAPLFAVSFQMGLLGVFLAALGLLAAPSPMLALYCILGWALYGLWRWRRQNELLKDGPPGRFWPRFARRMGMVLACVGGVAVPIGVSWWNSVVPGQYSMSMHSGGHAMSNGAVMRTVNDFRGPREGPPDRRFTLVAQKTMVKLGTGETIDALTYNGQAPGPELRVRLGDLVEVTLQNRDVSDGVTIHWHGIILPNAEDGVPGATQDAVMPGETYTYRFRAIETGTYWYHSHQHSLDQVRKGLFGAIIVEPQEPAGAGVSEQLVVVHGWPVTTPTPHFVGAIGTALTERRIIPAGARVHMRMINTDTDAREFNLTGAPFQVTAIDGIDVHEPGTLERAVMLLAAGGRYDVQFTMPNSAVRLSSVHALATPGTPIDTSTATLIFAPDNATDITDAQPISEFDPIHYGTRTDESINLQSPFDRQYTQTFETGVGFLGRAVSPVYLVNGKTSPYVAPIVVSEGQLIKLTFVNRWFEPHPIHPHGHRMLVLSRNGQPATGSAWLSDTLNVGPGETYEVAMKADNPGIWMNHCHNLLHAASGMVLHLMYDNVTTTYVAGTATRNHPE
jgi:FtsP/CotA-like multicopper oxidase with cupredoxin domain